MSGKIIRFTAIMLAVVCLTAAAAGCAKNNESQTAAALSEQSVTEEVNNDMNYTEYIKGFGVDLSGAVISEDGEITKSEYEYAYICLTLGEGNRSEAERLLSEAYGKMREVNTEQLPAFMNHRLAEKMKSESMIGAWKIAMSGSNGAKSRIITVYMTENNNICYLYFFG